ncbi:hypothetical protein V1512DRAFT_261269 [Lipomyces arxii]|uniref:uncharacterized protein n=1 Tax=Lipomyces arxii TaxID=56418 RepID=UPI0034CF0890
MNVGHEDNEHIHEQLHQMPLTDAAIAAALTAGMDREEVDAQEHDVPLADQDLHSGVGDEPYHQHRDIDQEQLTAALLRGDISQEQFDNEQIIHNDDQFQQLQNFNKQFDQAQLNNAQHAELQHTDGAYSYQQDEHPDDQLHAEIPFDPQLQLLDSVNESQDQINDNALVESSSEAIDTHLVPTEGDSALSDINLNELIMGMDLSDPVAAIAQLQSATNIDPEILLQAITTALSTILGEDEAYEVVEESGHGEDGLPRKKRRIRRRLPPKNAEERERLQLTNRRRKKRWRQLNNERNKDNDLRARLNRRADTLFGKSPSEKRQQWIEHEFVKRREKRISRMQTVFNPADALANLFGQVGAGDELQAALAEIMGRDGDIDKFNDTLLQLAKDPNLVKTLTSMMQETGNTEGVVVENGDNSASNEVLLPPDGFNNAEGAQEEVSLRSDNFTTVEEVQEEVLPPPDSFSNAEEVQKEVSLPPDSLSTATEVQEKHSLPPDSFDNAEEAKDGEQLEAQEVEKNSDSAVLKSD